MNIPCQPAGIDFRQLIPKGVAEVLADGEGLLTLHYQDSTGAERDREAAMRWLRQRVENADFDRVVITAGAQSALFCVFELLLSQGDVIARVNSLFRV